MEIAVEYNACWRVFLRRHLFDRRKRGQIAVETADDIKQIGGKIRRAREHRRRIGVVGRAGAAGLQEFDGLGRDHSAASFSAPPQLEPCPAVQP